MIAKTKEKPIDVIRVPVVFIDTIVRHAIWFIADSLKEKQTIVNDLTFQYKLNSLQFKPILLNFDNGQKNVKAHEYTQNIVNKSLVNTWGNPYKNSIQVVISLVANQSDQGQFIEGEFDDKQNRLSVYLLSIREWRNFDKFIENPVKSKIQALIKALCRVAYHEFTHVIQGLYPIDEGSIQLPSSLSYAEKYYLDVQEFMPLLYTLEQQYLDQYQYLISKLSENQKRDKDTLENLKLDILNTMTFTSSPKMDIVKRTTKPSGFFITLKKYSTDRWKKAVSILRESSKSFKVKD